VTSPERLAHLELLTSIRTKLMVQHRINVRDNAVITGNLDHILEFVLRAILGWLPALLVEFSQIPEVIDIIADRFRACCFSGS